MILEKQPLTLADVKVIVDKLEDKQQLHDYLKKFTPLSQEKSKKLAEELHALNNPKIRNEQIIKIVDFMPQNTEELNKILPETTLAEDESNSILEIVKKY